MPGDSAAAAIIACRRRPEEERVYPYYGRVVRDNGWIVLQYWIFYPFNNWRSGFFGANDHEADWEMISIYLYERPDRDVAPAWVAYASHEFHGDDLRRAWDDLEELEREGEHPIVYAGAGSHAAYFRRGEYVTEIEVPYLHRLTWPIRRFAAFWLQTLRQAGLRRACRACSCSRSRSWTTRAAMASASAPGNCTRGRPCRSHRPPPGSPTFGASGATSRAILPPARTPSGPMYNRDGTVRFSWYDPVGWAGLDDVPPPDRDVAVVERSIETLEARQAELDHTIASDARELEALGAEIAAVRGQHHLHGRLTSLETRVQAARAEAYARRRERAQNAVLLEALAVRLSRLQQRDPDAVTLPEERRAHIQRLARPASAADLRLRAFLEVWAASSIGLLLVGMVALSVMAPQHIFDGALTMIGTLIVVEAVFQRRLARLVSSVSVALAIVAVAVLVYDLFWQILVVGVLIAGLFVLWENIRELRR